MDNSDFSIAGNVKDILALSGSDCIFRMTMCVAFIVLLSGRTVGAFPICFLFRKGSLHMK